MIYQPVMGTIAATFTPMDKMGEVNLEKITDYAKKLKKDLLSGVFICGTTGEGMLMTLEERKLVAEEWMHHQEEGFKVIVHVGTTSSKQSQELAQHAQKIGAYGTSAMGPLFFKPNNVSTLVDFCAELAGAAPNIPFFYYHIPLISGIDLPMRDYIEEAKVKIPNFAGIKYTSDNLDEMRECNSMDNGKWNVFNGFDENLFKALKVGVVSAVGSTYNYMNLIYFSMIEDFKSGRIREAEKKQKKSNNIIEMLHINGGPQVAGKAIMKMVGIDCGPCRLPLTNLSENSISDLHEALQKKGFFREISR
ncbi:MAG: hypothetical protein CBD72_01320 [Flavobacteriaceae bacterium TMED212]|nr:MAG: hypothetical protein CBD72_01320 [Flavobacteriaceae bacterium TMED212]|tara:strand:+ start:383 stop:1300 length:918 start_codon:yes stop_codon:yes gene_type:complete